MIIGRSVGLSRSSCNNCSPSPLIFSYDSFTDSTRDDMKMKFALTMEFVEEYLKEVVNQPFPFGDKEKNKLTFEVLVLCVYLNRNLSVAKKKLANLYLFKYFLHL